MNHCSILWKKIITRRRMKFLIRKSLIATSRYLFHFNFLRFETYVFISEKKYLVKVYSPACFKNPFRNCFLTTVYLSLYLCPFLQYIYQLQANPWAQCLRTFLPSPTRLFATWKYSSLLNLSSCRESLVPERQNLPRFGFFVQNFLSILSDFASREKLSQND